MSLFARARVVPGATKLFAKSSRRDVAIPIDKASDRVGSDELDQPESVQKVKRSHSGGRRGRSGSGALKRRVQIWLHTGGGHPGLLVGVSHWAAQVQGVRLQAVAHRSPGHFDLNSREPVVGSRRPFVASRVRPVRIAQLIRRIGVVARSLVPTWPAISGTVST